MTGRMILVIVFAALLGLPSGRAAAAPPSSDPDWPCEQALVPSVSAEMVWSGPPLDGIGDWRSDPTAAPLVAAISPREVPLAEGLAAIGRFLRARPPNRTRAIKRAVAGLLEENATARTRVIEHIKMLAERQRTFAGLVSEMANEREKAGQGASAELTDRWTLTQRTYYEAQRTLRYACEIPAELDQRLGAYVRALQEGIR
ncbi:hypothetical protein [Telmatospirillum siberiense]|uniref:Secreted protein n=1 Tax=Telmatospirillum siberiense TaxID=382514 RepID=A0A2N3PUS0_9PROT|nr:hypothetical protein [Telmatospirillum siberiense]PKU24145.1 hypothetical protein CWS72_12450 [Telmatospirillum siberiense]